MVGLLNRRLKKCTHPEPMTRLKYVFGKITHQNGSIVAYSDPKFVKPRPFCKIGTT